ncbi:MAG TPA: hypothetical protein VGG99_08850 [Acetobacteraceae bacterium]|jgi:hypothetical protein
MTDQVPPEPDDVFGDLQRTRAFDRVSHEKLLATFEALKAAGHLPEHNARALYSTEPDLHVLLADPGWRPTRDAMKSVRTAAEQTRRLLQRPPGRTEP